MSKKEFVKFLAQVFAIGVTVNLAAKVAECCLNRMKDDAYGAGYEDGCNDMVDNESEKSGECHCGGHCTCSEKGV